MKEINNEQESTKKTEVLHDRPVESDDEKYSDEDIEDMADGKDQRPSKLSGEEMADESLPDQITDKVVAAKQM